MYRQQFHWLHAATPEISELGSILTNVIVLKSLVAALVAGFELFAMHWKKKRLDGKT
jgi:hypothetical protein